ncbi:hypothetical protein K1719_027212 [Acacia pycnantha]|nr:hypothetical protein K1719_027212 [Acacia pycnantha]
MSKIDMGTSAVGRWMFPLSLTFPRSIYILGGSWEQRGMGYGLNLPRSSQVGNQADQDDSVNEVVRDTFGVQDDNFIA